MDSLVQRVREMAGIGTVMPPAPQTTDPNVKKVGSKCVSCGSENTIVEDHPLAWKGKDECPESLRDHPRFKQTCLSCKRWSAIQ